MQLYKIVSPLVCVYLFIACHQTTEKSTAQNITADSSSFTIMGQDTLNYPTPDEQITEAAELIHRGFFVPGTKCYVVRTEGSALRKDPNDSSKVIDLLSFGDSVLVSEHPFTIDELKSTHNEFGKSFWLKVKGRGGEGYLLSSEVILSKIRSKNFPAHIFLVSTGCVNNYTFCSVFKYYAVLKNNDEYHLKKVQLEFSGMHEPWEGLAWDGYSIHIRGDEKAEPLFIYGLPKALNEGIVKQVEILPTEGEVERKISLHNGITLNVIKSSNGFHLTFYSSTGNEVQTLDFRYLRWCGDLDGDGKIDFVYAKAGGEAAGVSIALSTMASGYEVVKEVFTFDIGLCC